MTVSMDRHNGARLTKVGQLGRWWRTLRHLRPGQVAWRLGRLVERRSASTRWSWTESRLPRLRPDLPIVPQSARSHSISGSILQELESGTFHFLNQERLLGRSPTNWLLGPVHQDRLWTVTLHYQAWLYELARAATAPGEAGPAAAALFEAYLTDWLEHCGLERPGARELAWNSYAVATRIGWWVQAHQAIGSTFWQGRPTLQQKFLASLWQQAAYLQDHLEWDLRANHLLRDAVGLAWASRFFGEPQTHSWQVTARQMALEQAGEQILPDGGHFERSPMYHLQAMEDLFVLAQLIEDPQAQAQLRSQWLGMRDYLIWIRHPDGQIPLFNDAALNGSVSPSSMLLQGIHGSGKGDAIPTGGKHFEDSGLVVWHGQPWSVFFDVGRVGPDFQPGHAHADTLTIECSYRGRRLFVDPGTHSYDQDSRRRYDRSTLAHNTVTIGDQDSSEVWHIFRVGRRAYPQDVQATFSQQGMTASASHDGYDWLPGRPRHGRRVSVCDGGKLEVVDRISGQSRHRLQGGFLVAPGWSLTGQGGDWNLERGEDRLHLSLTSPSSLQTWTEERPYHPEFGLELRAVRLCWSLDGELPVRVSLVVEGI